MLWGPFCLCCGSAYVGFCPLVAPPFFMLTIWQFVWCGFDLGRAFLPSFALGLVFLLPFVRGLSRFVVLSFWCFCLRVCWCLSVAVVLPFVCGWAPLCLFCLLCSCRHPSRPVVASLPLAVGPLWRPGPVFTLVPPSGYLVALVTAWLPCLNAGGVVVLCRPYFFVSHGSKAFGPVWGVLPSTPCCRC